MNIRLRLVRLGAVAALVALWPASAALAQSTGTSTGTAAITGGALTLGTVSAASFSGTLNGLNQVFTSSNSAAVTDATGTGNGWNLTITGTQFTTGDTTPRTLPTSALQITGVTAAATSGSTATAPSNSVTHPLTVPVGATAAKFYNAAANSGMGAFTLTTSYNLSIPAATYAGTYSSTLTVSLISGP